MKCPNCQFENPDTQKFCEECGTKLEKACPKSGSNNHLQYKFCGECGQNLILPSEPALKDPSFDQKLDKIQRYFPAQAAYSITANNVKKRKHLCSSKP